VEENPFHLRNDDIAVQGMHDFCRRWLLKGSLVKRSSVFCYPSFVRKVVLSPKHKSPSDSVWLPMYVFYTPETTAVHRPEGTTLLVDSRGEKKAAKKRTSSFKSLLAVWLLIES
jgi:hypothetical protein